MHTREGQLLRSFVQKSKTGQNHVEVYLYSDQLQHTELQIGVQIGVHNVHRV